MMREYQVRICERLGVKFPGPTRHSRPKWAVGAMSGLPPIATELQTSPEVRFVPNAEVAALHRSIQQ
jgi:hypothetical protein